MNASAPSGLGQARRRAERLLRRVGRPGIAAIGLMLACMTFWLSAMLPLAERRAVAVAGIEAIDARLKSGRAIRAGAGLDEFYGFFRGDRRPADWLEVIYRLARENGLDLRQGTYRYNRVSGERLVRYEVNLPVRGPYVQIRRFLADVLNEIPIAALDQVSFEKRSVGDPTIEAQLRITLYFDPAGENFGPHEQSR